MKNINLFWISKEMESNKWYDIESENQLDQYKRIIDKRFGWPVFQLSLSPDFKQVKKTMI